MVGAGGGAGAVEAWAGSSVGLGAGGGSAGEGDPPPSSASSRRVSRFSSSFCAITLAWSSRSTSSGDASSSPATSAIGSETPHQGQSALLVTSSPQLRHVKATTQ